MREMSMVKGRREEEDLKEEMTGVREVDKETKSKEVTKIVEG